MKLISHAQLLEQPEGTVFQEFGQHGLGPVMLFGGKCGERDYTESYLFPNESSADIGFPPEVLTKFGVDRRDYIIYYPSGFGRDGMFDDTRVYLIWEQKDRERLAAWLLDPVAAVQHQNDDPYEVVKADWDIRAIKS